MACARERWRNHGSRGATVAHWRTRTKSTCRRCSNGLWHALIDAGSQQDAADWREGQDSLRLEGVTAVVVAQVPDLGHAGDGQSRSFRGTRQGRSLAARLRVARSGVPSRRCADEIDAPDADATGCEPIHHDGRRIGYVTSGAYGITCGATWRCLRGRRSAHAGSTRAIIGVPQAARILGEPHDPSDRACGAESPCA
jgi:hypothetical protein